MKYQNVILIYFTLPHGIRRSFWKTDPNPPLTQRLFLSKGKMLGQGKGRWVIFQNVIMIYFLFALKNLDESLGNCPPPPTPQPSLNLTLISHQGQNIGVGKGNLEILPKCCTRLLHVLTQMSSFHVVLRPFNTCFVLTFLFQWLSLRSHFISGRQLSCLLATPFY